MDEGSGAIDEIMLQDESQDVIPHVVMSLDQFSWLTSVSVLLAFAVSVMLCFCGITLSNDPIQTFCNITHNQSTCAPHPWTRLSRFASLTASTTRRSDEASDSAVNIAAKFSINDDPSNDTGPIADPSVAFSISKSVNVSRVAHVWTDFELPSDSLVYRIEVSEPRYYDLLLTSPSAGFGKGSVTLSLLGIPVLVMVYWLYRKRVRGEPADDVPPECRVMGWSNTLLILASSIWQYIVPGPSLVILCGFTRAVGAVLAWFQRGIVYALGKGRNVMARRTVSVPEMVIFSVCAVVDIVKAIVEADYYFRFPYGVGDSVTFTCDAVSLFALSIWTMMIVATWKRNWFFTLFFVIAWIASATGPVFDEICGQFKETHFRWYAILVPLSINLFLYIVTWPVKTLAMPAEIYQ